MFKNLSQNQQTLVVILVMVLIFIFYWNWKEKMDKSALSFCLKKDSIEIFSLHSFYNLKIEDMSLSKNLDTLNFELVHIKNGAFFYGNLNVRTMIPINKELKYINVNDNLIRIDTLKKCSIPSKSDSLIMRLINRNKTG
jgi:hypothetical protein